MPNINLTKIVTNQDTFGEMVEKINSNFDIISQAQGLRGEEGKRGTAGVPGPPGAIGTQGATGAAGERGSKWFFGDSFSNFETAPTKIGDFFLEGNTGIVYERINGASISGWVDRGTIAGSGTGGSSLFDDFIPSVNNKTTVIKPIKTNYTLEITDITGTSPNFAPEPFSSVGVDTSDFIMGGSTVTQNWLQEMGLKIYTSESDTLSSIYGKGKNIHLSNSTAFVYNKALGWQNQSGFTLTVDWGGTGNRHEETLKISNVSSGNINHKQFIDLTADEILFNADKTIANSPFTLYSVNRTNLTSPDPGTLIYDSNDNAVYAFEGSTWKKLSETGSGSGINYGKVRTFDNSGLDKSIDQSAITTTDVFRIKEGSGVTISEVDVVEGGTSVYKALEIGISSSTPTATDYFGTAALHTSGGLFTINASGNDTIEFEEGTNITLQNNSGKIKINSTASGSNNPSFRGFKYKFGQNGTFKSPLSDNPVYLPNITVQNNGTLAESRNLTFPVSEIDISLPGIVRENNTVFIPGKKGYWQINVFAFGLIELPDTFTNEDYAFPITVAGAIVKDTNHYSYLSIAESSTISPLAVFGNNFPENTSPFPWPTWTINCSDIVYINDNPDSRISVAVGALYAPINGFYNSPTSINLWYSSGFISATYLGS